jgi:hypothetical protein
MPLSLRFKCAHCTDRYSSERGLNIHIGRKHRNLKHTPASTALALVCRECGKDDFQSPAHLGRHRRFKHNVPGTAHQKKSSTSLETVPHHERAASTQANGNGHAQYTHAAPVPAALSAVAHALAIGSIKEFCRHFAEEHGFLTKQFTRECAELLLRETRR